LPSRRHVVVVAGEVQRSRSGWLYARGHDTTAASSTRSQHFPLSCSNASLAFETPPPDFTSGFTTTNKLEIARPTPLATDMSDEAVCTTSFSRPPLILLRR